MTILLVVLFLVNAFFVYINYKKDDKLVILNSFACGVLLMGILSQFIN